jgi:hypothetical protein
VLLASSREPDGCGATDLLTVELETIGLNATELSSTSVIGAYVLCRWTDGA